MSFDDSDSVHGAVWDALRANLGDRLDDYPVPPPVFEAMQAEFVDYDPVGQRLTARFPVCEIYLNPYGTMQGGMIAAAIDNTLGPLSVLVAPPNVTRRLEVKYSRPVSVEMGYIVVEAELLKRKDRWLYFRATVRTREGLRLAMAKAAHWITD